MQKRWFDAVCKIGKGDLKIDVIWPWVVTLSAAKGLPAGSEMFRCAQHDRTCHPARQFATLALGCHPACRALCG